jgi:hypothetical protein
MADRESDMADRQPDLADCKLVMVVRQLDLAAGKRDLVGVALVPMGWGHTGQVHTERVTMGPPMAG